MVHMIIQSLGWMEFLLKFSNYCNIGLIENIFINFGQKNECHIATTLY